MPAPRTVYLAGELFSGKHLLGNAVLASHIAEVSAGAFQCVLPQDLPQAVSAHAIRDQDLQGLLACDVAVFNYDGLELDSGTVVEYLTAKFADVPAVLLRTDFRHAGDQAGGDPWNLMNSFFPRTGQVLVNGMEIYQSHFTQGMGSARAADAMMRDVAQRVCAALERVLAMPPVLPRTLGPAVYEWLALMPGCANVPESQAGLYREKVAKGLL